MKTLLRFIHDTMLAGLDLTDDTFLYTFAQNKVQDIRHLALC